MQLQLYRFQITIKISAVPTASSTANTAVLLAIAVYCCNAGSRNNERFVFSYQISKLQQYNCMGLLFLELSSQFIYEVVCLE